METWASRLSAAYGQGRGAFEADLAAMLAWQGEQIDPLRCHIPHGAQIVVVPTGLLTVLPWAATTVYDTRGERRHWLEIEDISVAPTVALAQWAADAAARHGPIDFAAAISVANPRPSRRPRLRYAQRESAEFAPPGRILAERDATKTTFLAEIGDASLIHLACHCIAALDDPLASHLLFAGDQPLYASDLLTLPPLPARVAVLSGCETALVGREHVDENLGLATAFLGRGVPGVIATMWPVMDAESAALMGDVGRRIKKGHPPHLALLDAQRAAIRNTDGTPRAVATWAGFSFIGA